LDCYDVATGVALAAGGFTTAALSHVMNRAIIMLLFDLLFLPQCLDILLLLGCIY
jgi:hypothetical protein